tara:strand:- start:19197 stop:19856 length:660 start_codon:yes stop_codon:yes gene_type:complete
MARPQIEARHPARFESIQARQQRVHPARRVDGQVRAPLGTQADALGPPERQDERRDEREEQHVAPGDALRGQASAAQGASQLRARVASMMAGDAIVLGEEPGMGGHVHQESAARFQHAPGFAGRGLRVFEVLEHVEHRDEVEGGVRERQAFGGSGQDAPGSDLARWAVHSCTGTSARVQVPLDRGRFDTGRPQQVQEPARTRADVQDRLGLRVPQRMSH